MKTLQAEVAKVQIDGKRLASDFSEQRALLEQRLAQVKQERETETTALRCQLQELQARLHGTANTTAVERSGVQRQIDGLRSLYDQTRREGLFMMLGRALDTVLRI